MPDVARPFRTQLLLGAGILLALFLIAVAIAARATFLEQVAQLEEQSRVIAVSVMAAAEAGNLQPDTISRAIKSLPVPEDGVVVVLAPATRTIAASRGAPEAVAAVAAEAVSEPVVRTDPDGVRRAYAASWTANHLCQVVVGLPQRLTRERTLPIYRRNVIGAVLWYLVSVGALYLMLARWIRGVGHLKLVAAHVSEGDLRTPDQRPMPSRELDQLQAQMIDMITRVRDLQQQVVRQERLAAIGTLVSGVAHEISNPLQSILGSAQVMQTRADLPDSMRGDLAVIQGECVRAGAIIRNLTRFTRQQPVGPTAFALSDIVQWLSDLWQRRLIEQDIVLEVDDQSTRRAHAVATEIQQVALNFLVNAEYAVAKCDRADRRVVLRTRDTANHFVRLEVEDSGPGVSPEDEAQLFLPFFTTKPVGEGTGLGLSVSYGIIHSHGGCIGYERGTMGGAKFFFEIPATRT